MLVVADNAHALGNSRILDAMLMEARVARSDVELVSTQAYKPGSKTDHQCIVLCGQDATLAVMGWMAPPDTWHGTILPNRAAPPASWNAYVSWCAETPRIVVSFDLAKLRAMWEWHPLAKRDWEKAGAVERKQLVVHNPNARTWFMDKPGGLRELELAAITNGKFAFDTELTPFWMFGAATGQGVWVYTWSDTLKQVVQRLMSNPKVLKIAHNLQHDMAMCELKFGVPVEEPYFDTYGGATNLNTALERTLSPGISSRFTNWPYHKWLSKVDSTRYNGMDNIVTLDAAVEIQKQLKARGLDPVAYHDHKLLTTLYKMQMRGFSVDEAQRAVYEDEAQGDLIIAEEKCQALANPIIAAKIEKFQKPGLFRKPRKCTCCGGGKVARAHCWKCGHLPKKPGKKSDYINGPAGAFNPGGQAWYSVKDHKVAELKAKLPKCTACADGKLTEWLAFNPSSNDQVADVIYRGLGITPRSYKGKETVKAEQLAKIAGKHPLIAAVVECSKIRADLSTVERMRAGPDGKLHCVFDPWGTQSGRVAGKEGLLQPGTNPMNIPKKARRFVVPSPGHVLLYPDMAQIEARVVAQLCEPLDEGQFKRAFEVPIDWPGHAKHGKVDSHTYVQQMVSKWQEISRDQAKRLTYAVMYGVSAKQLAVELTAEAERKGEGGVVTEAMASNMIAAFFKAFPGVQKWHAEIELQLMQTRTIKSLTGRERHWPQRIMDHQGRGVQRERLKEAYSFVPQDVGAWVLANGIIKINTLYPKAIKLLVHVHDACLMECAEELAPSAARSAQEAMSMTMFNMWFPCEMKIGKNWYEAS